MAFKHVGRIKTNKRKVIVAYKTVPGEPDNCVVVTTENLDAEYHDALMKLVESDSGQNEFEFAEAMDRSRLPDGRIMLAAFHTQGKMQKVATDLIEMTPDRTASIMLTDLNKMIADQKGIGVEDLATITEPAKTETLAKVSDIPTSTLPSEEAVAAPSEGVLSDEDIAKQMRSQADNMFKEAQRLRKEADELVPTKKKATAKTKVSA